MSVSGSQQRTFLRLLAELRPHWRADRNLPARLQSLLARHRAFGARDRRLYRELIYTTLRYLPWIEPFLDSTPDLAAELAAWLSADSPATADYRAALLADWPPCPSTVVEKSAILAGRFAQKITDRENPPPHPAISPENPPFVIRHSSFFPPPLPAWFRSHCPEAFVPPNLDTLLARAPLWLRLQTDEPARVTGEFARRGWRWQISPVLPTALQLLDEVDATKTDAFRDGLFEVQDLGSQLVLETIGPAPGGRWLDACAGAGGKTLQLARLLGPTGRVDAHDIRPAALRELAARAARAGLGNISILPRPPADDYDGVLVDAPCSGSGTWRRAPHLKWTTTEADIAAAAATQLALLDTFAARVRPGGRLVYATCSLSRRENDGVLAAFLAAHPEFAPEPPARDFGAIRGQTGLTLLPATHNTDGFFVASLRRT